MEFQAVFHKRKQFFRTTMNALALDWPLVIGRVPNATREIPARLNTTVRAVENWLQGRAKPNGDNVVALMASFDEVADAILEASGRNDTGKLTQTQRRKLLEILGEE